MKRVILDTNVILRFILDDEKDQAEKAEQLWKKAKKKEIEIWIPCVVVFEILFILTKYYNFPKDKVIEEIKTIVASPEALVENREVLILAANIWLKETISFEDSFLVALSQISGMELATFDKKMQRLLTSSFF